MQLLRQTGQRLTDRLEINALLSRSDPMANWLLLLRLALVTRDDPSTRTLVEQIEGPTRPDIEPVVSISEGNVIALAIRFDRYAAEAQEEADSLGKWNDGRLDPQGRASAYQASARDLRTLVDQQREEIRDLIRGALASTESPPGKGLCGNTVEGIVGCAETAGHDNPHSDGHGTTWPRK